MREDGHRGSVEKNEIFLEVVALELLIHLIIFNNHIPNSIIFKFQFLIKVLNKKGRL